MYDNSNDYLPAPEFLFDDEFEDGVDYGEDDMTEWDYGASDADDDDEWYEDQYAANDDEWYDEESANISSCHEDWEDEA